MSEPLTVLHLIPTLEVGGAERQLSLLASEQVRRGYSVHVAVRRDGEYGIMLRELGVVIHILGDYRAIDFRLLFGIDQLLRRLKPQLVQTWLPQMDLIGGIVALERRVAWIATERASSEAYDNDGAFFRNFARKILVRWSSALVTNSIGGASYWRESLPKSNKLFIINNAIDHASISSAVKNANQPYYNQSTILIVGRLIPSKAFDVVLTAISRIPQSVPLRVKLVGKGPLRESIVNIIQDLKLDNRVELLGNINWWSQMAGAAMLVSMSRFEGQPNVVLEAMSGSCPLVVSDIPAHRDILDDQSAVFVPLDDSVELAIAIQSVLANPMMARVRAAIARKQVEAMTIENVANSIDLIYKFALEGNR